MVLCDGGHDSFEVVRRRRCGARRCGRRDASHDSERKDEGEFGAFGRRGDSNFATEQPDDPRSDGEAKSDGHTRLPVPDSLELAEDALKSLLRHSYARIGAVGVEENQPRLAKSMVGCTDSHLDGHVHATVVLLNLVPFDHLTLPVPVRDVDAPDTSKLDRILSDE